MKTTAKEFQCSYSREVGDKVLFCSKIQGEDSNLCPHHQLVVEWEMGERERKAKKLAASRAAKKARLESLEPSPLRAENPLFTPTHKSGYER